LPDGEEEEFKVELARSTEYEKQSQIQRLADFQQRHADQSEQTLAGIKQTISENGNGFEALMDAVRTCSLGQITDAFFEVGGQYRRST
jgi:methylmalonyl-CoA mutase